MRLETLAFLKDGKYRVAILKELTNSPKLPSEIAFNLEINRASVSRILRIMKEKGMVQSHSGEGRVVLYTITEEGKNALQECLKL